MGGKVGPTESVQPDGARAREWPKGRIPGVLEELLLSLHAVHPHRVYVLGGWGGAATAVAQVLEGGDSARLEWEFQKQAPHAEGMRTLYQTRAVPFEDYPEMKHWLRTFGVGRLSANNRLSPDENREMFWTTDTFRVVELLTEGLGRA